MIKIFDILMTLAVIISTVIVGYYLYEDAWKESKYEQIKIDINNDLKPNMTQVEIHNIVEVNCQNMGTESDTYYCVTKYEIEN